MLDNDLQIELLKEDSELRFIYNENMSKSRNIPLKEARSFNDLALSLMCGVLPNFDDKHSVYGSSLVEFSDIDMSKLVDTREYCGLAAYNSFIKFLLSPDISMRTISLYYQRFMSTVEPTEENIKISTEIYVSMMSCLDKMSDMWDNFSNILVYEKTYRSYGRYPRLTYETIMDLFYVNKDGSTGCILFVPNYKSWSPVGDICNIRTMHIIKHFNEIGIRLDELIEVRIPFSKGFSISMNNVPIDRRIIGAANRLFDNDYTLHSNPSMCTICPYYEKCSSVNLRKY